MGRIDANTHDPSSEMEQPEGYPPVHETAEMEQPEGYTPVHETADYDQNVNQPPPTRSYVPQENMPPPEAYPPQKPATYPPQQPATYPPQQPATYPPQQPQQPHPVQFPPRQQPVQFPPPQPQPVQFPPPSQPQHVQFSSQPSPQTYNYAYANVQSPMKAQGIAVGTQYLAPTQGWSNGLFDCADDPENAIITACFPCITFGQIAEIVDNGQSSCSTSGVLYCLIASFIGIPCIMSCSYRTKIRNRYGLMETPAPDWVTHFFCEWCALCQEFRELKARGLDPAIGWQGNMIKNQNMQQQYAPMTPPMNQTMM
ncbi:hypothetical protein QVD17_05621 [Tagetes erecta]|uniref:Uncharacterized protein n=1 Tax=Tagetes erecta TaxID=13708 RepID=A0AAD8P5P4_TARER|nr:hypothetical protein QVD17_05621 [Tagetes erecta]